VQKATVDVRITNGSGAPTCLDGTTVAPPGPATCAGSGMTNDGGLRDAGGVSDAARDGTGGSASIPDARSVDAPGSIGDAPASDGANGGSFGSGGTSGASGGTRPPLGDDGGCSCRFAGGPKAAPSGLLVYAFGALAMLRRFARRRRCAQIDS
jgi:hypothetical protein